MYEGIPRKTLVGVERTVLMLLRVPPPVASADLTKVERGCNQSCDGPHNSPKPVSYTHLRAHETEADL
eukprot:1878189-Amphidinium_carterae.1